MGTILLIVLIILVLGSVPAYPYSRNWGYAPVGGITTILLIVLLLMLLGVLPISLNAADFVTDGLQPSSIGQAVSAN